MGLFAGVALGGWLNANYGALFLPLEANSEQKVRHLTTEELEGMGVGVAHAGVAFLIGTQRPIAQKLARDMLAKHLALWQRYGKNVNLNNPLLAQAQIVEKQRDDEILDAMLGGNGNVK